MCFANRADRERGHMILVVDAYNVVKAERKSKTISKAERLQFIKELIRYAILKNHTLLIVFDGGPYPFPFVTEIPRGQLVYSGYDLTADDYIRKYLPENKHKALFLASSDHELIRKARQCNVDHMGGYEFSQKVKMALSEMHTTSTTVTDLIKITEREDPDLDALMAAGSRHVKIPPADTVVSGADSRKAAGAKKSKTERKIERKRDRL
jgi:predicted RNA-binding protein with PIN domain